MLAIIIPYYNVTFFEATLQSLVDQTNKRFVVYVGDDASPNNPKEIIARYSSVLNIIYRRFDENLGSFSLVKQWERCTSLINDEEWIMILGDDDVLERLCVDEFYKNLSAVEAGNYNLVRFASVYTDGSGKRVSDVYYHPQKEKVTDSYFRHFSGQSRSSLSEHVFRRSAFEENHFTDFPLAWHSDDQAWMDFTNFGYLYTINEAVVNVRISESSISGKSNNFALKQKARFLFIENLVMNKLQFFTVKQKNVFLLEYGILLKNEDKLTFEKGCYIGFQFLKTFSLLSFLKFVRRFYRAKYKRK